MNPHFEAELKPLAESEGTAQIFEFAREILRLRGLLEKEGRRPTMPEYEQKMLTEVQAQTRHLATIANMVTGINRQGGR